MAAANKSFDADLNGTAVPCHLLYNNKEIVRFNEGLEGPAIFSKYFETYNDIFKTFGIMADSERTDTLKKKFGENIFIGQEGFGEAFYFCYFPKMRKQEPEKYHWYLLK